LKDSLKELIALLETSDSIEIDEIKYKLKYYIGADYKMLRLLYGQKDSNASEACIYCKANLRNPPDINENWPITRQLKDTPDNFEPLIQFIDYDKCVIDLLHLLLRITDTLYYLLLLKLLKMDGNPQTTNLDERPNLKIFVNFLKDQCKIVNPIYTSEKSVEKFVFRNFNGNERIRIFKELFKKYLGPHEYNNNVQKRKNFKDLYPNIVNESYNFTYENSVWLEFYLILKKIKKFKRNPFDPNILKPRLLLWLRAFLKISKINRNFETIGPYLHIWAFHMVELLQIHNNINIFNTQGLEKLNGFCIQYYHTSTNKQTGSGVNKNKYLKQLMSKRNRIEFCVLNGDFDDFYVDEEDYEYDYNTNDDDSTYSFSSSENEEDFDGEI
jgi:hypothetical protein